MDRNSQWNRTNVEWIKTQSQLSSDQKLLRSQIQNELEQKNKSKRTQILNGPNNQNGPEAPT